MQVGGQWFWPLPSACGVLGTFKSCFRREVRKSLCHHPGNSGPWPHQPFWNFPGQSSVPNGDQPLLTEVSGHLYKNACKWFPAFWLATKEGSSGSSPHRSWHLLAKAQTAEGKSKSSQGQWWKCKQLLGVGVIWATSFFSRNFPTLTTFSIPKREGRKYGNWVVNFENNSLTLYSEGNIVLKEKALAALQFIKMWQGSDYKCKCNL